MVYRIFFVKKLKRLCSLDHLSLTNMWHKYLLKESMEKKYLGLSMSTSAMVTRNNFDFKFTAKVYVFDKVFFTIADTGIGSLQSLHSLRIICTICWWNLNKSVFFELHNFLIFLNKKWLPIFDKSLNHLKTFLQV